jgi:single-strand DNA-binding protein
MYQKTTLIGYLGSEPEQRFTAKGEAVTNFSLAVSDRKDDTTWFRVSVWGAQAESCKQYLHKGSLALVEGRLLHDDNGNPRTFQRKDGTTGTSFEVSASNVRFLPGKGDTVTEQQNIPF